ncbi:MAG: nucleotidyltransferase domain-containing protein [Chlorobia bacterium]|nr:nucleotidyltransferase domain-containing protein [Fimbriimonadaceae bacterium]
METLIRSTLVDIERETGCKVIYACESGSRAWGFDSPDSDWDVRFVYVQPADWYLSIVDHRDVIERMLPNDLDVSGWELRKALRLMRKSNPPFYEWLRSPIVYMSRPSAVEQLRQVANLCYSTERCYYHYRSMARGNVRDYFDREEVPLKKYLYVLRPILACKWIAAGLGPAPMEFDTMVERLIPHGIVKQDIEALVAMKKRASEVGTGEKIESIQSFIESEMATIDSAAIPSSPLPETGPLDQFFRKTIADFDNL